MLTPDNTLTLVIDIQERLLPVLHENERFIADTVKLITGLRALDVPLLLTEQYPKGLGHTVEAVKTAADNAPVFEKTRFSAWTEDVAAAVRDSGATNIIAVGCETHICMLQTVLDLRAQGLNVYLPQECLTSRTAANKKNGLRQATAAGAIVSNVESVLFQLLQDAKHPAFKTISKLIV